MATENEVKINKLKASLKNKHMSIKNKINLKEDRNCMTHEEEVRSHESTFVKRSIGDPLGLQSSPEVGCGRHWSTRKGHHCNTMLMKCPGAGFLLTHCVAICSLSGLPHH